MNIGGAWLIGNRVRVELTFLCRRHGGGQEYPDRWEGKIVDVSTDEALSRVQFAEHFYIQPHGQKVQKTDKQKCLWIPFAQLKLVKEELAAAAA